MREDRKALAGLLMGIAGMIAAKNASSKKAEKQGSFSTIYPGFEDAKTAFEELKRTTEPNLHHPLVFRSWSWRLDFSKIKQFFKRLEDQENHNAEWQQALESSIEAVSRLEKTSLPKPGISRMERRMIGTNFYTIENFLVELKRKEDEALARFTASWDEFWAEEEWSPQLSAQTRHNIPQQLSAQARHNVPHQSISQQAVPQQNVYGNGLRRGADVHSQVPDIWEIGREEFINQVGLRWLADNLQSDKLYVITSSPVSSVRDMNKVVVSGPGRLFDQKPIFQSQRFPGKTSAPIWFAYGSEWFDWMLNNMPEWALNSNYLYEITLNMDKVLDLDNPEQLRLFKQHSKTAMGFGFGGGRAVDWTWVTDNYSGIASRYNFHNLFATWDVPSGCVWKWDAINSLTLIGVGENAPVQNPPVNVGPGGSFSRQQSMSSHLTAVGEIQLSLSSFCSRFTSVCNRFLPGTQEQWWGDRTLLRQKDVPPIRIGADYPESPDGVFHFMWTAKHHKDQTYRHEKTRLMHQQIIEKIAQEGFSDFVSVSVDEKFVHTSAGRYNNLSYRNGAYTYEAPPGIWFQAHFSVDTNHPGFKRFEQRYNAGLK